MDNSVIAAMARWPDVPDVYGWLSLNKQGHWRLHPQGNAISHPDNAGSSISSPQILQFINNNYHHDGAGQWYFENGPQRVYVRLNYAPFIFHTTGNQSLAHTPELLSHNGLRTGAIHQWLLDDSGMLYVDTELGPGLVAGRDLHAVLQTLHTTEHISVLDALQGQEPIVLRDGTALSHAAATDVPTRLKFVRLPVCHKPPV